MVGGIALAVACVGGASAVPPAVTFIDLGGFGGTGAFVRGINESGQIVGNLDDAYGDPTGFLATPSGGLQPLHTIIGLAPEDHVLGAGISETGQIIGSSQSVTGNGFYWTQAGGLVGFPTIGGCCTAPVAIGGDGVVAGISYLPGNTTFHPVVWTEAGGLVDLGVEGQARAVSPNGNYVVGFALAPGRQYAFRWSESDGLVDLGTLGGPFSEATAVNDLGQVVGYSRLAGSTLNRAFSWTAGGGMVNLGTIAGALGESFANAVNESGQVVGRSSAPGVGQGKPFSWTAAGGMVDLGSLGGNGSGQALDVSDSGLVVGTSEAPNHALHPFLWSASDGMIDLGALDPSIDSRASTINNSGLIAGSGYTNVGCSECQHALAWQLTVSSDVDDDGVDDSVDTGAGAFDDGAGTSGSIIATAGLDVFVTDADDAGDGVKITVGPGSGKATFSICGFTLKVSAASEVVVSCASIVVQVVEGSAEVELGGGTGVISVPQGGKAEVTDLGSMEFVVENLGATTVTVTVDGDETSVSSGETLSVSTDVIAPTVTCNTASFLLNEPGATVTAVVGDVGSGPAQGVVSAHANTSSPGLHSVGVTGADNAGNTTTATCGFSVGYVFSGFFQPIDNLPTVNMSNGGQTIPVKWRITDYFGAGVSDPASFSSLTSGSTTCSAGDPLDTVETYSANSGLQYQGDGNWQYNWKTTRGYAGQCRVMRLNLADGASSRLAEFRFR